MNSRTERHTASSSITEKHGSCVELLCSMETPYSENQLGRKKRIAQEKEALSDGSEAIVSLRRREATSCERRESMPRRKRGMLHKKRRIFPYDAGRVHPCGKRILTVLVLCLTLIVSGCSLPGLGHKSNAPKGAKKVANGALLEYPLFSAGPAERPDGFAAAPYLNYEEIFADNPEAAPTGRYATTSPDGKINWNENQKFAERPEVVEFFEQITLNGKSVHLPTTFRELGPELEAFDKIDVTDLGKKVAVIFQSVKTGYKAEFVSDPAKYDGDCAASIIYNKQRLFDVWFREEGGVNTIHGLFASIDILPCVYDLRIKGIGIGSTFNEAYEALGMPDEIDFSESTGSSRITYRYVDPQTKKRYDILLRSWEEIVNPKTKIREKVNGKVISWISIHMTQE